MVMGRSDGRFTKQGTLSEYAAKNIVKGSAPRD